MEATDSLEHDETIHNETEGTQLRETWECYLTEINKNDDFILYMIKKARLYIRLEDKRNIRKKKKEILNSALNK